MFPVLYSVVFLLLALFIFQNLELLPVVNSDMEQFKNCLLHSAIVFSLLSLAFTGLFQQQISRVCEEP